METRLNKQQLIEELLNLARFKEAELKQASKDAQERANEAEGAMISRYDTFKEEGQYLAGGLMIRYRELKQSVEVLDDFLKQKAFADHEQIQHYSYIEVVFDDGREGCFFMAPVMGGEVLFKNITIITPSAPVGQGLMGKEEGDRFSYSVGGKPKKGEIVYIV